MVSRVRISEDVAPDKIVLRTEGLGGIIIGVEIEVDFQITVPASTRLRLHTAGGDINITNVSGIVVASSTNGGITAKAIAGGVDARSTNGSIAIDLASVGKDAVDLRAVNGNISLTLPSAADANIEATCTNGAIDIADLPIELTGEQSRRRARGRLNGAALPSRRQPPTGTSTSVHARERRQGHQIQQAEASRRHRLRGLGRRCSCLSWSSAAAASRCAMPQRRPPRAGLPAAWTRPATVVVYVLLITLLNEAGSLPLSFYGGFILERRYGFSKQPIGALAG